nr:efflux transporter, outer membrane factor (OMF) lipoprotein, NodT family [Klebsiella pneumoniae]
MEGVWWRNFHDSTLNQYVDRALRYNSDVLIARERVNEYQARAPPTAACFRHWTPASPAPAPGRSPPPPACRSTAHCIRAA